MEPSGAKLTTNDVFAYDVPTRSENFIYRIRFQNRTRLFQLWMRLWAPLIRRLFWGLERNLGRLGEEEELLAQSSLWTITPPEGANCSVVYSSMF